MRKLIPSFLSFFTLVFLFVSPSIAQINVVSTNGYVVDINVRPVTVLPASTSCTWGYNYNVKLDYQVIFTGSNKPASLSTLQGTVGCSSATSFFDLPNNGGTGTVTAANAWRSSSDCNTITASSLACNTVNIEISGPGISARTVSYPVTFTPLPVNLLNFEAKASLGRVTLNWATSSESNNDFFIIERSVRTNEWDNVGQVKGANNSSVTRDYSYQDLYNGQGTVFYRLKQVDLDGHIHYSPVVSVNVQQAAAAGLSVYPVPNRGNNIGINGLPDYRDYSLSILDINERALFSPAVVAPSMDLPELKPGIYLLRFTNRNTNTCTTLRYLKL